MPRKKTNLDKHDERHQTTEQTAARKFYFKVCRACLATRVKMHNITEQGLGDMYKQVTGIEIIKEDNLPQVLCWECVARLSNASKFIERALRTRWILTNKQINNGESLTINSITSMNKTEYGLNSTLGYKFFNGNYANVHINHDTVEADINVTGHLNNNNRIHEAGVDREVVNSKETFTSSDHAFCVTYKEEKANNVDGIKREPLDIQIENEVNIKEECFSDEEMVVESNNEMLQESIKKELQFDDNATSEDNNESHTSIKERIKFEENLETFSNSTDNENINNSNPSDPGNTSMDVNDKMQYTCDVCNETFICKTRIARHLENHPEIFSCSLCAYKTSHKDQLTIHTNAEHTRSKELHCSFCSYTTYDKNALQEHINAQHIKITLYSCTFCAYKAYNKNNLNKHITAVHSTANQNKLTTLDCTFCDFQTMHKIQLLEHINIKHTKRVPFICSFCNYKTYDKNSLSSHINSKHIKNTIYKCSYCNFETYEKYHINRHVKAKHK